MADDKRAEVVAEAVIDELARASKPGDLTRLDRQFAAKLARLEAARTLPDDVLDRLRLFWRMLKAPDTVVPWKDKALLMAALGYFAAPLDLIPDLAGKAGYADDAMVIRIVHDRVKDAISAFAASQGAEPPLPTKTGT